MTKHEIGNIKSVDPTARTVTLDNGHVFNLAASVDPAAWKAGDRVNVTYDDANGGRANATVAKSPSPPVAE